MEIDGLEREEAGFYDTDEAVDFILRASNLAQTDIAENTAIHLGKQLVGGYTVAYLQRGIVDTTIDAIEPADLSAYPVILGLLGAIDLSVTGILQVQRQPYLGLKGGGMLIGVVDTGVDYTLPAFRYEDGSTKIISIWDQTIAGAPPSGYLFGSQYSEEDINRALSVDDPYAIVPQRDTVGHGTFLAAAAAGREAEEYIGAAPDADLLVVKLRKANPYHLARHMIPSTQENAFASSDVMLGINYILEQASERKQPVSIFLGLGTNFGSHDGFSPLEGYLARVSHLTGVSMVVAAGNEVLARHHTHGRLAAAGATKNIEIQTGFTPDAINVQIWNSAADIISISLRSPGGELVGPAPARPGSTMDVKLVFEQARVNIQYHFPLSDSGGQLTWVKVYDPNPGIWTIIVHGDSVMDGNYHAWLPMTGFLNPDVAFIAPTPDNTITVPATAIGVMSVGAYSAHTGNLYVDSSWGPTRLPMLAPVYVAPGVCVNGVYPLGHGAMSGTSVSAAMAAGVCTLLLQWGTLQKKQVMFNSHLLRSYLIGGCERDPGIAYPNDRWGYGRLNLMNTFVQLRG
ncbi:MAG: S8 family peptidase [Clostridiales bacterium]|jgi:hypothetical protein|nr:S8 family peptidase [Clostridiales bacterium]